MLKGGTYVAMGDSWTWAVNTTTVKGSHYYATKLRDAIRKDYGACRLINKGIGGMEAVEMVKNLPWLNDLEPDLVTIGVGINDCANDIQGTTNYKNNLRILIDTIRLKNPNVIIILCTPGRTTDPIRTPYVQSYRDAMVSVATEKGLPVCHFEDAWTDDTANLESDKIHPNTAGQTALFNQLYPVVKGNASGWLESLEK